MLHFTIHEHPQGPFADRAMTPARYISLRRTASGFPVDQIATLIAPNYSDRPAIASLIRMLETDGTTSRRREIIETMAAVFPLDPDVYYQPVTEPADRLPRICQGCGCSEYDPCAGSDGICGWSTPSACTRCIKRGIAAAEAEIAR